MRIQSPIPAMVLALLVAASCGKDSSESAGAGGSGGDKSKPAQDKSTPTPHRKAEAPPPSAPPAGPTGTIKGTITLVGDAPQMPKLRTGADPACAKTEKFAETIVVGDGGGLQDVLVRVAPGDVPGWVPAGKVTVDQQECVYRPRVSGAVIGQTLEVTNSDPTMHNVHLRDMLLTKRQAHKTLSNKAQVANAPPIISKIEDHEVIKIKCEAHAWMQAYVVPSDNPYFNVSGANGEFTIENVPVGERVIQTWHAYYGLQTQKVAVEEGKTAELTVAYDVKDAPPFN